MRGYRDSSVVEHSAYLTCNKPRVWERESWGVGGRRARRRQTRRRSKGKKHFKISKYRDQG